MRALVVCATVAPMLLASCSTSGERTSGERVARASSAIQNAAAASDYPEAVLVNLFCSGVLLSPTVVLTAGHCKASTYTVTAPNAANQTATASHDRSFFQGDPRSSHDVLLVFLDSPISIASYPTIASTEAPAGTAVVEVGRNQNGQITGSLWKTTDAVSISGPGDDLGFPYNYEARPDVSQDGDSGGEIVVAGTHEIVAIVDTDTVEQSIPETQPIDLFARVDQLHDDIEAAIASGPDVGDAGPADDDAGASANPRSSSSGGCALVRSSRSTDDSAGFAIAIALSMCVRLRRSRRRHR